MGSKAIPVPTADNEGASKEGDHRCTSMSRFLRKKIRQTDTWFISIYPPSDRCNSAGQCVVIVHQTPVLETSSLLRSAPSRT